MPFTALTCCWCGHESADTNLVQRDEDDGTGVHTFAECADLDACEARVLRLVDDAER